MSILDRIRNDQQRVQGLANDRLQQRAGTIGSGLGAIGTGVAAGLGARGINALADLQAQGIASAIGNIDEDTPLGRATRRIAEQFGVKVPSRKKPPQQVAQAKAVYPGVPWGGLTPGQATALQMDAMRIAKGWKNLWHLRVTEYQPTTADYGYKGVPKELNLLATDVQFAPITMPGESVPIGSANLDNLAQAERVEMRLTTYDTADGVVKRWLKAKADQAVRLDGTFGLPSEYLFVVTVTDMDPLGQAGELERFQETFLMRVGGVERELSRREAALEELQVSFVQFDTFIVPIHQSTD